MSSPHLVLCPCLHDWIPRSRKNVQPEMWAIDLVLPHADMDRQDWTTLITIEVTLLEAIPQEAIRANVHPEEADMMTMAEITEEEARRHHGDG